MIKKGVIAAVLFVLGCVVVHDVPPGHAKRYPAEPRIVLMPGTTIYYAPDVEEDIYFVGDVWYLRVEGVWYSAGHYNGPWVAAGHVPPGLAKVPPGHLKGKGPPGGPPPGQIKKGKEKGPDRGGPPGQMKKEKGKGKGKKK